MSGLINFRMRRPDALPEPVSFANPREMLTELSQYGGQLRSWLAFASFVVVASMTANMLLMLAGLSPGWDSVFGFAIPIVIFGGVLWMCAIAIIRDNAYRRGISDIIAGAIVGLLPTLILGIAALAILQSSASILLFAVLVAINTVSGALAGLAYWIAVGMPDRKERKPLF